MTLTRKHRCWIQDVTETSSFKKGQLSRNLDIPESDTIPLRLVIAITGAKVGTTIINPTAKGKERIVVTATLKRRANFAKTMRKFTCKRE
jgi:hypothetical protein